MNVPTRRAGRTGLFILGFVLLPHRAWSDTAPQQQQTVEIDQLVAACMKAPTRDKICEALIEFKQIGEDAVESIKGFVHLTPTEYAALTVANVLYTRRFRVKPQQQLFKGWENTLDVQSDSISILFELKF